MHIWSKAIAVVKIMWSYKFTKKNEKTLHGFVDSYVIIILLLLFSVQLLGRCTGTSFKLKECFSLSPICSLFYVTGDNKIVWGIPTVSLTTAPNHQACPLHCAYQCNYWWHLSPITLCRPPCHITHLPPFN